MRKLKISPFFPSWQMTVLFLGTAWISINIFFLPFFPWSTGITRTWFILHGYLPYRDFTWLRTPFDLFLLGGWFKLFGVSEISYRYFIYILLLLIAVMLYFFGQKFFATKKILPFLFFVIFLFPLFLNTEMGEIVIGLLNTLLLIIVIFYLTKRYSLLLFIAGLICGFIIITKQNAAGVILAVAVTVGLDSYFKRESFLKWFRREAYLTIGFIMSILGLITYYWYQKALYDLFYYTVKVVLINYRNEPLPPGYSLGDGMWIEYGYFAILLPFIIFWKQTKLSLQKVIFIFLFVISLFPSLFPSYLSYRTFTAYPIISVVAAYDILLFIHYLQQKNILRWVIVLTSFITFIILSVRFIQPYLLVVQTDGFHPNSILRDYGDNERKIAEWIKTHTDKNEKILNWGNEIIYFLADRFPKYKYIEPIPSILAPYEKTSKLFIKDPPRIVVYDNSLVDVFIGLRSYPFIEFLKKNYKEVGKYGDTLVIYQYNYKNKIK